MTNALAIFQNNNQQLTSKFATSEAKNLLSSDVIPALQLMTGQSKAVKTKKFSPAGNYALVRNQSFVDVGTEVSMLVISWRPKAVRFKPEFCAAYNPDSEIFKTILRSAQADPRGANYGPELLVLIPGKGFATFYMGNKSSRAESQNLLDPLTKGPFTCVMKVRTAENSKGVWDVPEAHIIDFDIKPEDVPTDYQAVLDKFLNPPESTGDDSEAAAASDRD